MTLKDGGREAHQLEILRPKEQHSGVSSGFLVSFVNLRLVAEEAGKLGTPIEAKKKKKKPQQKPAFFSQRTKTRI